MMALGFVFSTILWLCLFPAAADFLRLPNMCLAIDGVAGAVLIRLGGGLAAERERRHPISARTAYAHGMLITMGIAAIQIMPIDMLGLVPPCPFRRLTGLLCPLCGGTHSLLHLARGEWAAAWRSNALVPIALVVVLTLAIIRASGRAPQLSSRGRRLVFAGVALVVGVFAVGRNLI